MTESTGEDYAAAMNFRIPDEKEIRTVFSEGEESVVAPVGGLTAQIEELAVQPDRRAGMLKDLQGCRKTAATAESPLQVTDTVKRT